MLALLAFLFVADLSAVGAQSFDEYSETLFCREVLQGTHDRPVIMVSLEVDSAHRPLGHSISMGRGYHAIWNYPPGGFRQDLPPDSLEISSVAVKRGTQFPATATILFDGRAVWAGEVPRARHTVVGLTGSPEGRSFQPGIAIDIGAGGIPSLFGVRNAEIVVTAADGAETARESLALPDWSSLESRLPGIFTRLEAERLAGRCRPTVTRTIVD